MGAFRILRGAIAVCATIALLLLVATASSATVTPTGAVTLFPLPKQPPPVAFFGTSNITTGPDGNLWFTQNLVFPPNIESRLARITPQGKFTGVLTGVFGSFDLPGLAAGHDGNLWLTEHQGCGLARVKPGGSFTTFPGGPTGCPWGIAAGPDGNVWYTSWAGLIARVAPTGATTEFSTGITAESTPLGIAAGPDGNLWFTEESGNRIGRITPAGKVTEFSSGITPGSEPQQITRGPDGNVWFTEGRGKRIARITPTGKVTEFSIGAIAEGITAGPDGNVWFTEQLTTKIGRITPTGTITEFPTGAEGGGITTGPDGNLWFNAGERIGRISAGVCGSPQANDQGHRSDLVNGQEQGGRSDHAQCHRSREGDGSSRSLQQ
jgi:streptogramin lyase